ncbi:MAG: ATP-binding protein [Lachnospiraceae bacterium]|nr:ATP-binding protein [Lachnospiraceae bacterium]MDE6980715.1 ATP-binding protein [Lachnospiraceae bacterium]
MEKAMLPLGIENFQELREKGYYYVDKTELIKTFLENPGKVNLFTRPRRFGKTLNMSMLKHFFEVGSDGRLFEGLDISREKKLCDAFMGKFPAISITLKSARGENFNEAKGMFRNIIGNEALRFQFLADSGSLTGIEQKRYEALINIDESGAFTMSDELLKDSLRLMSQLLQKHYGQSVVMLIDEYDVPLDRAYQSGYYDAMVEFIRILFENAFKTNDSLNFAVLTGCLRISKESIFSGFNNLKVFTAKDVRYMEYFGFTDGEVRQMLQYYRLTSQYDAIKEWYDGYLFGSQEIYCPWDVINYCGDLRDRSVVKPQNYWVNTSSNSIIRSFLEKADGVTKNEIERLIGGESIKKKIRQELTYRDLDSKIDNLWSILFTTGYLTQRGEDDNGMTGLVIPNKEIQWIFEEQIQEWFKTETRQDIETLKNFCRAFEENDVAVIEKGFTSYLRKTISIRDTNARKEMKENFYHGILLGLFAGMEGWSVKSNAESGEGYSDISVEVEDKDIGIIIELKYAEKATFEEGCREALKQIRDRNYEESLIDDGMTTIRRYGIACYKKRCKVMAADEEKSGIR